MDKVMTHAPCTGYNLKIGRPFLQANGSCHHQLGTISHLGLSEFNTAFCGHCALLPASLQVEADRAGGWGGVGERSSVCVIWSKFSNSPSLCLQSRDGKG